MNIHEAHLKVIEHFSKPDARLSHGSFGFCRYRFNRESSDAIRCGVGTMIPDHLYQSFWDLNGGKSIGTVLETSPGIRDLFKDVPYNYLGDVQVAHDLSSTVSEFLEKLDKLALKWKISLVPDCLPDALPTAVDEELVPA